MDLNADALAAAAQRVRRYAPETYRADVLTRDLPDAKPFRSIALTYLLHCLPGDIRRKGAAFDNLLPLLAPGGVVFGATLLGRGLPLGRPARALMSVYNRKGIFANLSDDPVGLEEALTARFHKVQTEIIGCAALFVCREPR